MAEKKRKHKRKSFSEKFTYSYLRHIKKWMYCPNCKTGKMVINKEASKWQCESCEYELSADEFEDDYIFWFCDECEAYLNAQKGFDRRAKKWICTSCGYENDITIDNIKGICIDCGKVIPESEQTLCLDCHLARKKKAKEWLIAAGIAIAAVGIGFISSYTKSDDSTDISLPPPPDDDDDYPICDACGAKMTEFDGWAWYTCPECGNRVRILEDGATTWERDIFGPWARHSFRICEYCGESLEGGEYTLPWENGSNRNGYTICPHCGRANFEDDD